MNDFVRPKTHYQKFCFYLEVLDFLRERGGAYTEFLEGTWDRVAEAILTDQYVARRNKEHNLDVFMAYTLNNNELFIGECATAPRAMTVGEMLNVLRGFEGVTSIRWRHKGKHLVRFRVREGKHGRRR